MPMSGDQDARGAMAGWTHPVEGIADVLRVSLPLPYAPGQVNAWLIEDGNGWTVIDVGALNEPSCAFWRKAIEAPLRGRPIQRIIATHHHTDHIGLAGWLCDATGASFHAGRSGYLAALALRSGMDGRRLESERSRFRAAGCEAGWIETLALQSSYRDDVGPLPPTYVRIADGDDIMIGGSSWKVISTEGHAIDQLTFFNAARNILLSADQVLANAQPMLVATLLDPFADPLADFARSLRRLAGLPEDVTILPGHGAQFVGLHAEIARQLASRARRLVRLADACREPLTACEIATAVLRRSVEHAEMTVVIGETLSHLDFLVRRGVLERATDPSGPDLYRALATPGAGEAEDLLAAV